MKKQLTKQEDYQRRVDRVVEYIRAHLDEKINVATLANLSAFSPFHFHRIMKAYLGESIGAFMVRLRVEKAAKMLCHSHLSISQIAYCVGYDTPSSLTKAFVKLFGISPTQFRQTKNYQMMTKQLKPLDFELNISNGIVKDVKPSSILYCEAKGNYSEVDYGSLYEKLWQEVERQNLFSDSIEHLAIYFDNPEITLEDHLRCNVCLSIDKPASPHGEIGVKELPGGRFAVFTYTGAYDYFTHVYDKIFRELLPAMGQELRGDVKRNMSDYSYEKYLNDPCTVPAEELVTEIYIPVE